MIVSLPLAIGGAALAAFWLGGAGWAWLVALRRSAGAGEVKQRALQQEALLGSAPALPLLVAPGGAIEGPQRLADWLGFEQLPDQFSELVGADRGLDAQTHADLLARVSRSARGGGDFTLYLRAAGGERRLRVSGGRGPSPLSPGTVLLWFADATSDETRVTDLTAQRDEAEAALETLGQLIEAAPFPIWYRGQDLRLRLVNRAYVEAVEGASVVDVVERNLELVEGPDGAAQAGAVEARARGGPVARPERATVAGERRVLRVMDVPVGEGVAGYALDIQELEGARGQLQRFVDAQRDMLDRLSAGVAQFGRDRQLVFTNQPFAQLFELPLDWLAERPEFDRVLERMREAGHVPDVRDFPAWKSERREWFAIVGEAQEEAWLLPGGTHLRVVAQPLPDGGLLLIFEDRTREVQLASARDTLLRVRSATLENLSESIGVFASDGRLSLWNNRFRAVWDLTEADLVGHPRVDDLVPRFAHLLEKPDQAGLLRELVRSATVDRRSRAGRVRFTDGRAFDFAAVPLPDGNALFTMLDVTDRQRAEEALRERAEALEAADRVKTAFVANMSYELRTPLTSIGGFAEMLDGGYAGPLEPGAREYVRAIIQSVERLGRLVDDVLDLTQTEAGAALTERVPVNVEALCRAACAACAPAAAEAGLELAVELEPGLGEVQGDARRLGEALDHLLRNAVAGTDRGGRILLHAAGNAAEVVITVSDNGRGIDAAEQERVWDRFHGGRVEGGPATLGLGLPLTRGFIEAHGGRVDLASQPGVGTSVTMRLPRGAPPARTTTAPAQPARKHAAR